MQQQNEELLPSQHPCLVVLRAIVAIPLPAVAVHKGATIVSDHPLAKQIFDPLGKAVVARNANELDVLMCISCMMGPYYKTCGVVTEWFE